MGLRLEEALSLQTGDIDAERKKVHIRRGKGHKDRFVPLPDLTLLALRELWKKHRHPKFLFPNAKGSLETIRKATTHGQGRNTKSHESRCCRMRYKKKSLYTHFATT